MVGPAKLRDIVQRRRFVLLLQHILQIHRASCPRSTHTDPTPKGSDDLAGGAATSCQDDAGKCARRQAGSDIPRPSLQPFLDGGWHHLVRGQSRDVRLLIRGRHIIFVLSKQTQVLFPRSPLLLCTKQNPRRYGTGPTRSIQSGADTTSKDERKEIKSARELDKNRGRKKTQIHPDASPSSPTPSAPSGIGGDGTDGAAHLVLSRFLDGNMTQSAPMQ